MGSSERRRECTRGRRRGRRAYRFAGLAIIVALFAPAVVHADPFAYVPNNSGANISQYDAGGNGALTPLSPAFAGSGTTPVVASSSPDGQSVYVTNQADNALSQYDVGTGGALTPKSPATVATGLQPIGIAVSPDGANVYVTNSDGTVSQYDIGTGGTLTPKSPATVAAGNSPTLVTVSPDGASVYVTNQSDNTVSQYDVGTGGVLTPKTPATVATGLAPISVRVSPDGSSAYVTNASASTVSQYDVGTGGVLTPKTPASVATGLVPVDVLVSPDGASVYVTNNVSDDVSQYDVGTGGILAPKAPATVPAGATPQLGALSPDGTSLYVATFSDNSVSQYDVGTGGGLTAKTPAAVAAGVSPISVATAAPQAALSVDDVTQDEGDAGTTTYTFTITRSGNISGAATVDIETEDDSATDADNDYEVATDTLSFAANDSTETFDVTVNGDTKFEPSEAFNVKLSNPSNATISDDTGVGTITNDDSQPTISIDDVTHNEGNSGTTAYQFTVSLSNPSYQNVGFGIDVQDDTATTADSDYQDNVASTQFFSPGQTSKPYTVQANGDNKFEADDQFKVVLSVPSNATIADDTGVGTITNDDPTPTLAPNPFTVSHNEGNAGPTPYVFTIQLDRPSYQQVQVTVQTQNGNATLADNDYQQLSPTVLTFAPGDTSEQVTVNVNGDTAVEPDEQFTLQLSNSVNADIFHPTATGEILNDDTSTIQTQQFPAVADARVEEERSSTNFGSSTLLRVDNDDEVRSYLRFNPTGISGTILSAKLKVFATEGTSNGPAAYKTNWTGSESSLTWNNKTSATSGATDDKGSISSNTFVEYNVTPLVTGNGLHSFILRTSSSDGVDFASRETSTVSRRPVLTVTYGIDTEDPEPPTLSAQATSSTQVALSWSGATDNFGVTGYKVYRNNVLRATLGNQTSYTDSASPGQTYVYEVTALDAAGNESARSNAVTVKTPFTFTAVADARVEEANKSSNFGTSSTLRAVGGSNLDVETFLRFQVSGTTTISNVKLRLWVTNGTTNGPAAYKTTWTGSETSLTWNSRTARTSGATDDKGSVPANGFVDFNVTPLVVGNGAKSFILATTSSDGIDFSSRETSTSSRRPALLITP